MLFASNFLLNCCQSNGKTPQQYIDFDENDQRGEEFTIYPYLNTTTNLKARADVCRGYKIPDIDPLEIMNANPNAQMSFAAGEFEEVYGRDTNRWGGVTTCFFIDTAPFAISYIKTIYDILESNGIWCSIGPLHYHWSGGGVSYPGDPQSFKSSDERYDSSIDLAYDEIREIIVNVGFEIVEEKFDIECSYTADDSGLKEGNNFQCVYFVARKK